MTREIEERLPFSRGEFGRRLATVRNEASRRGLDALVLTTPENIYYVSGFQTLGNFSYQALVVPVAADPCFVIRYAERPNVLGRSWLKEMELYRDTDDPVPVTTAVIARANARRVGLEMKSWFMPVDTWRRLAVAGPNTMFEDCSGLLESLRVTKSDEELVYVEAAARVSSAAVRAGIEAVCDGRNDRDVAAAVYQSLIQAGGDYPALPPMIAVGPRTALFHNTWSGQPINRGDVVFMEIPGVAGRYLAPIARSASLGAPPAYVTDRFKIARESLEAGIAALRPGITYHEAYEAFAKPYVKAGYEVPIGVGYCVGIVFPPGWPERAGWWPEPAFQLLSNNRAVIQPGMVFHTPRSVRVPGEVGAQVAIVSQTTAITERGHKVLTEGPVELAIR